MYSETDLLQRAMAAHRQNDLAAAEVLYREILTREPGQTDALYLLGVLASQRGRSADAIAFLDRAIGAVPSHVNALIARGNALMALGRAAPALADFDRAIAVAPAAVGALNGRGCALQTLNRFHDALAAFDRVLEVEPENTLALANRGGTLTSLGLPEQALMSLDAALRLQPASPASWHNRGNALRALDRLDDAYESYSRALALLPHYPEALLNRALVLIDLKRLADAAADIDQAMAMDPRDPRAHINRAICALLAGDYRRGLPEYEWRWENPPNNQWKRGFAPPLWLGNEDIASKTILLHAEQGLGDTIQFARFAAQVAARGAKVFLEVQPALEPLMRTLTPAVTVIARGEPLPAFDRHCPLLSLPLALGITFDTIPAPTPYLGAAPDRLAAWGARLPAGRRRIGLAWSGNPALGNDRHRSIALSRLAPLLALDATFVSLQTDVRAEDRAWMEASGRISHFGDALYDFADTAALIALMDEVVSVDTAAAHLAGALGKRVTILLPHIGVDWRWGYIGETTPWYPSARLVRQPAAGDWDSAITALASTLRP